MAKAVIVLGADWAGLPLAHKLKSIPRLAQCTLLLEPCRRPRRHPQRHSRLAAISPHRTRLCPILCLDLRVRTRQSLAPRSGDEHHRSVPHRQNQPHFLL